jgi:hypothetical protein
MLFTQEGFNIRLGWKGLPEANTLAYYKTLVSYCCKSFFKIGPSFYLANSAKIPHFKLYSATQMCGQLRDNKKDWTGMDVFAYAKV